MNGDDQPATRCDIHEAIAMHKFSSFSNFQRYFTDAMRGHTFTTGTYWQDPDMVIFYLDGICQGLEVSNYAAMCRALKLIGAG